MSLLLASLIVVAAGVALSSVHGVPLVNVVVLLLGGIDVGMALSLLLARGKTR